MENLTISVVAQRAGIRASAIRYYESIGLLPEPRRISGQRRYDASIVQRLAFIQAARKLGFTVAEMLILLSENGSEKAAPISQRWQILAQSKLIEVRELIQRAEGMQRLLERGLSCSCPNLDECIDCVLVNSRDYDPFNIF